MMTAAEFRALAKKCDQRADDVEDDGEWCLLCDCVNALLVAAEQAAHLKDALSVIDHAESRGTL